MVISLNPLFRYRFAEKNDLLLLKTWIRALPLKPLNPLKPLKVQQAKHCTLYRRMVQYAVRAYCTMRRYSVHKGRGGGNVVR